MSFKNVLVGAAMAAALAGAAPANKPFIDPTHRAPIIRKIARDRRKRDPAPKPMRPRMQRSEIQQILHSMTNWQFNQFNRALKAGRVKTLEDARAFTQLVHHKTQRRMLSIAAGIDIANEFGDPSVLKNALAGQPLC